LAGALRVQCSVESGVDEVAQVASFAAEVDGVESLPGEHQEVQESGIEYPGSGKDQGTEASDKADGSDAECIYDGRDR